MNLPKDILYEIFLNLDIDEIIRLYYNDLYILSERDFWINKFNHEKLPILVKDYDFTFQDWVYLYTTTLNVMKDINYLKLRATLNNNSNIIFKFNHISEFISYLPADIINKLNRVIDIESNINVQIFFWGEVDYDIFISGIYKDKLFIDILTENDMVKLIFNIYYTYPKKRLHTSII